MNGVEMDPSALEDLKARATTVSPAEAAQRLGLQESTLANWRWCGRGPPHLKVGSRVRYREIDLVFWLESQLRGSTSDEGQGTPP